ENLPTDETLTASWITVLCPIPTAQSLPLKGGGQEGVSLHKLRQRSYAARVGEADERLIKEAALQAHTRPNAPCTQAETARFPDRKEALASSPFRPARRAFPPAILGRQILHGLRLRAAKARGRDRRPQPRHRARLHP